jgi:hypothetical protein
LHQESQRTDEKDDDQGSANICAQIGKVTQGLAPFLVPMINYLGALTAGDVAKMAETGDEE